MSRSKAGRRGKDPYAVRAKKEGYPSRASYKLLEIHDKFRILGPGDQVLELGCSPGGWTKATLALGASKIVAVDPHSLLISDERVTFLQSQIEDLPTELGGVFDVILSDVSPPTSGSHSLDQARSVDLAEQVLGLCDPHLKRGGDLVIKVIQGDLYPSFLLRVKARFRLIRPFTPKASRPASSEIYIIGRSFKGSP